MINRLARGAVVISAVIVGISACTLSSESSGRSGGNGGDGNSAPLLTVVPNIPPGETGRVTHIVDGDTIDVDLGGGDVERVRYIGMNTPESDEPCYREATNANAELVTGKTVTLVKDVSETDRYGRLLRYVYADGIFVNAALVIEGYAEGVEYPPDTEYTAYFRDLERVAAAANRGCHPTGIFNDGSTTR